MTESIREVLAAFGTAWQLRWRLLAVHVAFNAVLAVILVPLMALTVRLALWFAGQPALSDFDIAFFLLSPVGFLCFLIIAGLAVFIYVLDVACMMALAGRSRNAGRVSGLDGLWEILPQAPRLIDLGARLTLRVLVLCLPFVVVAGGLYLLWLTEYDINYYLSNKPPEFMRAVVVIGAVLAVMALVLLRALIGWALILPLVLFDGVRPREAFAKSRQFMRGKSLTLLRNILIWSAISFVGSAVLLGVVGGVADVVLPLVGDSLRRIAAVLLVFGGLGALVNLLVVTLTTGALAVILMALANWPERSDRSEATLPRGLLVGTLVAVAAAAVFSVLGLIDLARVKADPNVQIIAHRGAAGSRPENTMVAFEKAIEDGTDWIELDVQESAEGEVIVVHDSDFMKIAGVNLKAWDATAADLADIDIGGWFDPAYADQRTPLLRDALTLAKGKAGVVIELKYYGHDEKLEERVAGIVEELEMQDQVRIMSLKYAAIQKMRALRPDWNMGLLATASLGRMWELDVDFLAVNQAAASHRMVRETRKAGKELFVWTVNDALSMSHMVSLGVSGLITDEPALARQVLTERRDLNTIERMIIGLAGSIGLDVENRSYRDESP